MDRTGSERTRACLNQLDTPARCPGPSWSATCRSSPSWRPSRSSLRSPLASRAQPGRRPPPMPRCPHRDSVAHGTDRGGRTAALWDLWGRDHRREGDGRRRPMLRCGDGAARGVGRRGQPAGQALPVLRVRGDRPRDEPRQRRDHLPRPGHGGRAGEAPALLGLTLLADACAGPSRLTHQPRWSSSAGRSERVPVQAGHRNTAPLGVELSSVMTSWRCLSRWSGCQTSHTRGSEPIASTPPWNESSTSSGIRYSGMSSCHSASATASSWRARWEPRQRCAPAPNAR